MAFCKLLLTVLVLLHNSGGLLGNEVRSSIIGAEDAKKESWPWMVHLNMTSSESKMVTWRCGGTVVAKQWVLTSAQCIANNPDHRRSFVIVGAYQLQKAAQRYMAIANFVPYQDLGNSNSKNDIALIKLKKPIAFSKDVAPVALPDKDDTFGPSSECWITGWGEVGNDVPLKDPETLQQLKISIISQSTCKKTLVGSELDPNTICTSDSKGRGACKGDYGGPLVCRKGGKFVQVGIMSSGGCGPNDSPGICTAVAKYLTFINDYIHRPEKAPAEM